MEEQAIIRSLIASSPEILAIVGACFILIGSLFMGRRLGVLLTISSLVVVLLCAIVTLGVLESQQAVYGGSFIMDPFAIFFKCLIFLATALTILMSGRYLEQENIVEGEYHVLILFAMTGMMIMVSGTDLLVIYMGLELQSICFYVLVGFRRQVVGSNEAALKYVILGAVSSGIFLYGLSLVYGLTGSTQLSEITSVFIQSSKQDPMLILAVIFLVVGLLFKVGAVPLHMWVPDVYEGAPTPITAFLSVGSKAAAFAILLRILMDSLASLSEIWIDIVIVIAVATMALGSFVALAQSNIKRMLAYSSIAHAGFALLGIIAGGEQGVTSVMLYLLIYTFMNFGLFSIVIMMQKQGPRADEIYAYTGLAASHPVWAFLTLIFLFSMAGIPPTAGFFAKFYVLLALLEEGYVWIAVIAVLLSAVAAYFYLRIIMLMYMKKPIDDFKLSLTPALILVLLLTGIGTVGIGLAPDWFLAQAQAAFFSDTVIVSSATGP
ncbi:NADH-quinone oxidoreductase subunit N [Alphaproteobacteria bacterium 46_93_T64]|nr:NADH-quinone oxidoreductase subunit N [Alphaproteobacteria bacterium 46_93_T64]